jgi:PKD repeat protein
MKINTKLFILFVVFALLVYPVSATFSPSYAGYAYQTYTIPAANSTDICTNWGEVPYPGIHALYVFYTWNASYGAPGYVGNYPVGYSSVLENTPYQVFSSNSHGDTVGQYIQYMAYCSHDWQGNAPVGYYPGAYYWNITTGSPPPPVANFTGTPLSGIVPLAVNFTDNSTGSPTGWYWNFGDGMNSTVQNPIHYYTYEGTFDVNLTASNGGGSSSLTRTSYITANATSPLTNIAFSATPLSGYVPLTVNFTDISNQTNTIDNWTFGDGYVDNGTHSFISHTYTNTSGMFSPRLDAFFGGTWRTLIVPNYIFVNHTYLSFYANTTNATAPGTVQFWSNFS